MEFTNKELKPVRYIPEKPTRKTTKSKGQYVCYNKEEKEWTEWTYTYDEERFRNVDEYVGWFMDVNINEINREDRWRIWPKNPRKTEPPAVGNYYVFSEEKDDWYLESWIPGKVWPKDIKWYVPTPVNL